MHGQLQQLTILCCRCISREQFCFAGALFSLQQQTVLFCNSSVLQAHCLLFSNQQFCVAGALFSLQQQTVLCCRRTVFTSATNNSVLQAHRSQPVEDSQDLYGGSESDHNNSIASSAMHTSFSDDAVSQILDADG